MKQRLVLGLVLTMLIVGCTSSMPDYPSIYLVQRTGYEENGEKKFTDSLYILNTEYFDINLYPVLGGTSHIAQNEIESVQVGRPFHYIALTVADSLGESGIFNSSTEFLNFMAKRGYDMATQTEKKYHIGYTFKKKESK